MTTDLIVCTTNLNEKDLFQLELVTVCNKYNEGNAHLFIEIILCIYLPSGVAFKLVHRGQK